MPLAYVVATTQYSSIPAMHSRAEQYNSVWRTLSPSPIWGDMALVDPSCS